MGHVGSGGLTDLLEKQPGKGNACAKDLGNVVDWFPW